jgi:Domain of unknown function DUF11
MNDEGKIEELKKKLYSTNSELPKMNHVKLHDHHMLVNRDWDEKAEQEEVPKIEYNKDRFHKILKGMVVFSLIFLVAAMGVAYYYFNINPNVISGANIEMSVSGPVVVSAGQELSLDVNIFNNNSSLIQAADLIVTYPEGTRRADDKVTSLITDRISIGDIQAGATNKITIKSILLAEEGSTKNINIALEYKLPGTNSLFNKEKTYPMSISSGPVSISIDSVKEITPEQKTKFMVSVKSNSDSIIKNVVLKAEYPFGFDYISANPDPSSSNTGWRLGDIAPGEIKKIQVDAKIFGQVNQERTVRFFAGTAQTKNPNEIDTTFASAAQTLNLTSPFLGADVAINGIGDEIVVVNSGQFIQGEILWKNNLDVSIHDVSIEAKLNGISADRRSVMAENGFYKSESDTLYWEKSNNPDLEDVSPNESGTSRFNMKIFDLTKDLASNLRKPEVTLNFTVKGNRLNENKVSEEVTSQASRKIRVASDVRLDSRLVYNDGPFQNTGPLPPKVESKTTYTVDVRVYNSYNTVKGLVYTTKLPIYVNWLGVVNPMSASSSVVYNSANRTITWNAGDIGPAVGYISNPKEMFYQVEFSPSLSQEKQTPTIVNGQRIAGTDSFTNTVVGADAPSLSTQISSDSKHNVYMDSVVEK